MKWEEVRALYPNQWVLLDISLKIEREGKIIPIDMKVINTIPAEGLLVKKTRNSPLYMPYHTKHKYIKLK
ncbi:hypothetical protein O0Q50_21920 [Priestia aryabhattai]|uniref:Uncharacterized protein n=1 Tax=Priestia aryabhattai TaxID=412384 RepID=A0AAX6NDW0_PRIAR|nr:hypothetical protein [Priestia aryabhattai]MDU9693840.1 hypothetical protein [Priestia aryabhattai]